MSPGQPSRWRRWAVLSAAIAAAGARAGEPAPKLDAALTTSTGAATSLSAYFGKPMLLFYEDPDAVKVNQAWKDELAKRSKALGLVKKVETIGVCDLRALNWQPALFFALFAVRGEEEKAKIRVLLDLTGALERAPWRLSAKKASVAVLSASGELLFSTVGAMSKETFDQLVEVLTRALTAPAEAPRKEPQPG